MKPRKIVVKGAPSARRCAIPSDPWTTTLGEDSSAPIDGMAGSERWPAQSSPIESCRGRALELIDLRLAGLSSSLWVACAVEIIESLAEVGSLNIQHLHVGDRAALVVVHDNGIAVGRDAVGRLEPVGMALGLPCSGIKRLVGALSLHQDQGTPSASE